MSQEAKIQRLTPCLLPDAGEGNAGLGVPGERRFSPRRALAPGSAAPAMGGCGGGLPAEHRCPGETRVPSVAIQNLLGSSPSSSLSFFFPFSFPYFLPLLLLFLLPQGFSVAQEESGGHFPSVAVGRGETLPEVTARRGGGTGTRVPGDSSACGGVSGSLLPPGAHPTIILLPAWFKPQPRLGRPGGKTHLGPKCPPFPRGGGKQHGRRRSEVGGGASPQLGGTHREGESRHAPISIPGTRILHPPCSHPSALVPASFSPGTRILRGAGDGGCRYPQLPSPLPASSIPAALILHPRSPHPPSPLPASSIPGARVLHPRSPHPNCPHPPPLPPSLPLPLCPPSRCPRTPAPPRSAPGTDRRRCGLRAGRSPGAGRAERGGRRPAPRAEPWGGRSGGGRPAPGPGRSLPAAPGSLAPAAAVSEKGAEPPPGGGGLKGPGAPLHGGRRRGKLRQRRGSLAGEEGSRASVSPLCPPRFK
ncbi:uncharacterized protein LOC135420766 [Pseudopipra pipra]|uniref:uncharacterized protein LOC135420766 n=1 Tax=Pseudopipra pipra TaxID=415032 RepID=UPI0031392C43